VRQGLTSTASHTPTRHAAASVGRVRGIDSARGLAMVFVCLSHFGLGYFGRLDEPSIASALTTIGLIGSPAFMLMSGVTLGLLHETRRERFDHHRLLLADRALFMLTVGHLLILIANAPRLTSLSEGLQRGFITDVIAVAILLGPTLVVLTSQRTRVVLSLVLFAGGWLLAFRWTPTDLVGDTVRYLLVGPYPDDPRYNFPLVHWFAVYVASTVLGQWLGRQLAAGRQRQAEYILLVYGAAAVLLVVLYKLLQWTMGVPFSTTLAVLMSPWTKLPPSPAYLLFYGGLAFLLLTVAMIVERRNLVQRLFKWTTILGRASFFVFILQFYVYDVLFWSLKLPYTPFWPALFVASLAGITALASIWDTQSRNQYLTVGLRQFASTRTGHFLLDSVGALWRPRVRVLSEQLENK
jgi:uncharacterized membrane protein